jgi:hypothetical protein
MSVAPCQLRRIAWPPICHILYQTSRTPIPIRHVHASPGPGRAGIEMLTGTVPAAKNGVLGVERRDLGPEGSDRFGRVEAGSFPKF